MIASLRGTVIHIGLGDVIIECAGVGYRVQVAPVTAGKLTRGKEAFLLTTAIIREDAHTLYGFDDGQAQDVFALLQTVQGIGPKLALAAIAVLDPIELARAVSAGDLKTLSLIPGVGKRVAERMVVDLRDKVGQMVPVDTNVATIATMGTVEGQLGEALEGLGFTARQYEPVLKDVLAEPSAQDAPVAELLRGALRRLGRK